GRWEDQGGSVAVLDAFVVDPALDGEARFGAEFVGGGQPGAQRGAGGEVLALEPLQGPLLPVPHGHIVGYAVAGDRRGGFTRLGAVEFRTDDDGQLGLPVDGSAAAGRDRLVGAGE